MYQCFEFCVQFFLPRRSKWKYREKYSHFMGPSNLKQGIPSRIRLYDVKYYGNKYLTHVCVSLYVDYET